MTSAVPLQHAVSKRRASVLLLLGWVYGFGIGLMVALFPQEENLSKTNCLLSSFKITRTVWTTSVVAITGNCIVVEWKLVLFSLKWGVPRLTIVSAQLVLITFLTTVIKDALYSSFFLSFMFNLWPPIASAIGPIDTKILWLRPLHTALSPYVLTRHNDWYKFA